MSTQEITADVSDGDQGPADSLHRQQDGDVRKFNLSAEGEVCDFIGRPRILNLDTLNAKNIASFAREQEFADLLLTLIYLAEGPDGVRACTRNDVDDYLYNSQLRVPTSLVCGTSDGDICYKLNRHGDQVTIKIAVCIADKCDRLDENCHKHCAPCPGIIDFGIEQSGDVEGNWRLRACQVGLVTLIDSTQEVFRALCFAAAVLVVEMILRYQEVYNKVIKDHENRKPIIARDITRDRLWVEKPIPGAPRKSRSMKGELMN